MRGIARVRFRTHRSSEQGLVTDLLVGADQPQRARLGVVQIERHGEYAVAINDLDPTDAHRHVVLEFQLDDVLGASLARFVEADEQPGRIGIVVRSR